MTGPGLGAAEPGTDALVGSFASAVLVAGFEPEFQARQA